MIPGRLPSPNSVTRHAPLDVTEVTDTPNLEARHRRLPEVPWQAATLEWWAVVREMPHTVLWSEADWIYATDTAKIKDAFYAGIATPKELTEMRIREDNMGTTMEARRKLRIRYVEPKVISTVPATVTNLWSVPDDE